MQCNILFDDTTILGLVYILSTNCSIYIMSYYSIDDFCYDNSSNAVCLLNVQLQFVFILRAGLLLLGDIFS